MVIFHVFAEKLYKCFVGIEKLYYLCRVQKFSFDSFVLRTRR